MEGCQQIVRVDSWRDDCTYLHCCVSNVDGHVGTRRVLGQREGVEGNGYKCSAKPNRFSHAPTRIYVSHETKFRPWSHALSASQSHSPRCPYILTYFTKPTFLRMAEPNQGYPARCSSRITTSSSMNPFFHIVKNRFLSHPLSTSLLVSSVHIDHFNWWVDTTTT